MAKRFNGKKAGFTLVEILAVVAVIATLGSAGYVAAVSTKKAATEQKLRSDVDSVNRAIQLYTANGGSISNTTDPNAVLAQLKVRADNLPDVADDTSMGMRGSFLDARIGANTNTTDDSAMRAVWNDTTKRFELATSGAGVSQFTMDEALAAAATTQEARSSVLKAVSVKATNAHWIWDYAQGTTSTDPAGEIGGTAARNDAAPGARAQLPPPTISPASSQTDPLTSFPKTLTINFTKPSGMSGNLFQIVYLDAGGNPHYGTEGAGLLSVPSGINPGDSVTAWVRSLDVENWSDSTTASGNWDAPFVDLNLTLTTPTPSITYFQAGGAPETGAPGSAYATATVTNAGDVLDVQDYRIVSSFNGATLPAATGSVSDNNTSSVNIPFSYLNWAAGSNTLVISAQAKALSPTASWNRLNDSNQANLTISKVTLPLGLNFSEPNGSSINPATEIIITKVGTFPAGATVRYTINGNEPTIASPVYSTPITLEAGDRTVKAAIFLPAEAVDWFTITNETRDYLVASLQSAAPFGVIVNTATLQNNAVVAGNMVLAKDRPVTDLNIIGNARIKGNLYVPGTPNVFRQSRTTPYGQPGYSQWWDMQWRLDTDAAFAPWILGRQFDINGVETVPATEAASPRVKDTGGGSLTPTNYSILIQETAKIEGKVIRQYDQYGLGEAVASPTPANNTSGRTYDSWTTNDSNPGRITQMDPMSTPGNKVYQQNASSNAGSTTIGAGNKVRFTAGDYKNVTIQEGSQLILGDPTNPDVQQVYSFTQLNFNGTGSLIIVGKVVVTFTQPMVVHNGGTIGDPNHPERLILKHYTASNPPQQAITFTSNSMGYAQIVAPKGVVIFENGSSFKGSVTAYDLQLKSENVLFNLPAL